MNEEENKSVETEVSQEVTQPTESQDTQERLEAKAQENKKRNDVEYNWAEARRKMQEQERQIKELSEHLQKIQPQKAQAPEEDELDKLGDDDIVTKAHAKKLAAKMAREIAHEVIKQREASTVEERVKLKYSDYDDLVTTDNIELLKQTEPELALSIAHNPDPYAQAVAVYKALKRLGVEKPNPDKERAIKNAQKPVSVNAVSKSSAIGNVHMFENGLTPELKKSLYEEMRQAAKRA